MSNQTTPQPAAQVDIAALPSNHHLNPDQVAAVLGVSVGTLSIWRCTGRYSLIYIKIGRKVYYRAGDLLDWLDSRTRTHTGHTKKPARRSVRSSSTSATSRP